MSNNILGDTHFHTRLRGLAVGLSGLGLAMAALGIAAIAVPMFSTRCAAETAGCVYASRQPR